MADDFVTVAFPAGSQRKVRVRCVPAGKRRFALWHEREFLGHAIARVDGTWAGKTPDERTHEVCANREAALQGLLALRARVDELIQELTAADVGQVGGGRAEARPWSDLH